MPMTSEKLDQLFPALIAAQAAFDAIPKTDDNPFFHSKFAGMPIVVQTAQPVLTANGLGVIQVPEFEDGKDTLTTMLVHSSGQFISGTMQLRPVKNDPQAQGSAITYGRRYAYQSVLGLVAEEDDDGNAASRQPEKSAQKPAKAQESVPQSPQDTAIAGLVELCTMNKWNRTRVNELFVAQFKAKKYASLMAGEVDDINAFKALLETGAIKVPAVEPAPA